MTREEAIKIIDCYDIGFYDLSGEKIPADKLVEAFDMAIEALKQEPRSVSRWIDADLDPDFAKCKNCSEHKVDIAYSKDFIKQERWNFCPYCGADMRGDQK